MSPKEFINNNDEKPMYSFPSENKNSFSLFTPLILIYNPHSHPPIDQSIIFQF